MKVRQSMDLFGEALLAYHKGDRSTFYLMDEKGKKHIYSLKDRFRSYSRLNKSEKKLISLSFGDILDVGCGTGNVIPALKKKGRVLGIDISPRVIEVARSRDCEDCIVADILTFSPKHKFDTITLFGNNLGIGGTARRTKKLLQVLKSLLKDKGQILAIIKNYTERNYKEMELTPIWKRKAGPKFGWIIFDENFLKNLCQEQGLNMKVLSRSWEYGLIRITK